MNPRWIPVIMLGVGGLVFWPLAVIAACMAISLHRGPDHYTKHVVPYAYRFKFDPGWALVGGLAVIGGLGATLEPNAINISMLALAAIISFLRTVVWTSFRFPLTSWFLVMLIAFLFGIGWRARFLF